MSQVVDASAMVSALVDTDHVAEWCEARIAETDLVAPDLLLVESANILRRLEIRGERDPSTIAQAFWDLRRLPVDLIPFEVLAERAWELRSNLTLYDAVYVAAAELVGGRLVTLDRRLNRAPGVECEVLVPTHL